MKKTVLVFSLLIIALLLLFQLSTYAVINGNTKIELVLGAVAIAFLGLGLVINKKRHEKQTSHSPSIDFKKIKELGLSNREYEVLQKIAEGLSNKEIADSLFLSESTIKTHVSSLLIKLNARRRTQALQISKALNII